MQNTNMLDKVAGTSRTPLVSQLVLQSGYVGSTAHGQYLPRYYSNWGNPFRRLRKMIDDMNDDVRARR